MSSFVTEKKIQEKNVSDESDNLIISESDNLIVSESDNLIVSESDNLIDSESDNDNLGLYNNFTDNGFIVINDVVDINIIEKLSTIAMLSFKEIMNIIKEKNYNIAVGIKEGFSEITQRHLHRFEMTYKMNDPIYDEVFQNNDILSIVKQILGDDAIIVNRSVVISLSGASDQSWHCDGPHMSATEHLPCHCLNVFIPLVDTNVMTGPTEFRPSSHYLTRDFAKMYLSAFMGKRLKPTEAPCLNKGSVLLFDYRVLHRGLKNISPDARPVLVFTFAKPFFRDVLNFSKRSVFH